MSERRDGVGSRTFARDLPPGPSALPLAGRARPFVAPALPLAMSALLLGSPLPLVAQDGTVVGAALGGARTTQIWRPEAPTEREPGIVLGLYADAATPLPGLSVRGEASWTRRAGRVDLSELGQPVPGALRTDYLSVAVHAKVTRGIGPLRVHLFAGPTLDQVVSSRLDSVLAQILEEERALVFAVGVGAGVGVWLRGVVLGADVRLTEGLGDAYRGGFRSVRNRSVEGVFRLGVPLAALRGG